VGWGGGRGVGETNMLLVFKIACSNKALDILSKLQPGAQPGLC